MYCVIYLSWAGVAVSELITNIVILSTSRPYGFTANETKAWNRNIFYSRTRILSFCSLLLWCQVYIEVRRKWQNAQRYQILENIGVESPAVTTFVFELPVKGSTHVDPIDLINAELPTDRHEDIMQQVELYQVYPHSYKSTVKLGSITEYSIRVECLIQMI